MVTKFWLYIFWFIIPINVRGKYSKSNFKIRRWQRYCLHNMAPFRFRYTSEPWDFDSRETAPTTPPSLRLSGKVAWWVLPLKSQNSETCIHVDTNFLLVMLCIGPFAKTSENENKVESKGILKILRLVSNYVYKVSKKWRMKCTRC